MIEGGGGSEKVKDSSAALSNALEVILRCALRDLWFITHISSSSPEDEDDPSSSCEGLLDDVVIATSSSSPESDVSPLFVLRMDDFTIALACVELLAFDAGDKRAALDDSDPLD